MVNLSQSESDVASRVRLKQRSWFRRRWYFLSGGFLITAMGAYLLFQIAERTWTSDRFDGETVWVCPLAWYMLIQGVMMWAGTLVKWRGDGVAILLLKLLDEATSATAKAGAKEERLELPRS
jgi:hypothetical protein